MTEDAHQLAEIAALTADLREIGTGLAAGKAARKRAPEVIRRARALGMTQAEIAALIGEPTRHVQRWEHEQ